MKKYTLGFLLGSLLAVTIFTAYAKQNSAGQSLDVPIPKPSATVPLVISASSTVQVPKYNILSNEDAVTGQIDCLAMRESGGVITYYTSKNGVLTAGSSCQ